MMAINIFSLTISVITILWILSSLSIREEEDEEDVGGPGTWNWESVLLPVANKDETPASSSNRSRPTPVLVYNRVPKCGSTTLVSLLTMLAKKNKFYVASSRVYNRKRLDQEEELELVNLLQTKKKPLAYDRHFHHIDWKKHDIQVSILYSIFPHDYQVNLINMVRHPVDRMVSNFYFVRNPSRWVAREVGQAMIRVAQEGFTFWMVDCVVIS